MWYDGNRKDVIELGIAFDSNVSLNKYHLIVKYHSDLITSRITNFHRVLIKRTYVHVNINIYVYCRFYTCWRAIGSVKKTDLLYKLYICNNWDFLIIDVRDSWKRRTSIF
jgi:hypothetical protein